MSKQNHAFNKLQAIAGVLLALIVLIALIITRVQTASGQTSEPLASQIDQYIREQMTQKNIVGMSVAI
ncbi:MAG: hypothetical protein NTX46_05760, partial [Chloroflexi bacterium]|nr:hypothetical protein [Chloroflexota bacterium]